MRNEPKTVCAFSRAWTRAVLLHPRPPVHHSRERSVETSEIEETRIPIALQHLQHARRFSSSVAWKTLTRWLMCPGRIPWAGALP